MVWCLHASLQKYHHIFHRMTKNRAFVARGSQIGVFSHGRDGEMEFVAQLATLTDQQGETINPSKV